MIVIPSGAERSRGIWVMYIRNTDPSTPRPLLFDSNAESVGMTADDLILGSEKIYGEYI